MELGGGHGGGAGVPVEAGDGAAAGGVVLQAVLARYHQVAALVLRNLQHTPASCLKTFLLKCHLNLPLPRGGGAAGIDVDIDGVALVGGGDEHVLAGVVATDDGRTGSTRHPHRQAVHSAVPHEGTVRDGRG